MHRNMTQMSARPTLPNAIPMNVLDRCYVIPETEDEGGPHFPMSLVIGLTLRSQLSPDQLLSAIQAVNERFPQFRLGYRLDPHRDRWLKVPADQLPQHLAAMVRDDSSSGPDSALVDGLDGLVST